MESIDSACRASRHMEFEVEFAGPRKSRMSPEEMARRVELYAKRHDEGRSIWEGRPLAGKDAVQWLQVAFGKPEDELMTFELEELARAAEANQTFLL